MSRRKTFRDSTELWRDRLQRQARGKWSVAEFCRREGISPPSFYHWRKRLGGTLRTAPRKRQLDGAHDPEFVPVQLPTTLLAEGVQIELPGGAVVRLPRDASAEVVAAALRAVCASDSNGEAPRC